LALLSGILAALVESPPIDAAGVARDLSGLAKAIGGATVEKAAAHSGVDAVTIRATAASLAAAKDPIVYVGARLAIRHDAAAIGLAAGNLGRALGHPARVNFFVEGANGRGAEWAGLVPGDDGLPAGEIVARAASGEIKALYIVGENLLESHPDATQAREALERAEVVIVHELFPTATAQLAHVVFAATSVMEKEGTLTSVEGRLQRIWQGVRPDANRAPDWRIVSDLAGAMGSALGYVAAADVTRDLLADLPVYASLAGALPGSGGVLVRGGTVGADNDGEVHTVPEVDLADDADGLALVTYPEIVGHETMISETPELLITVPEAYIEVNRADAAVRGIVEGSLVEVHGPAGTVARVARVTGRVPAGTVFAPENLGKPRINAVLRWSREWARVNVQLMPVATMAGAR
jgi:predicted molibdopterin-dependent oxidoreductase YjgC